MRQKWDWIGKSSCGLVFYSVQGPHLESATSSLSAVLESLSLIGFKFLQPIVDLSPAQAHSPANSPLGRYRPREGLAEKVESAEEDRDFCPSPALPQVTSELGLCLLR